MHEDSLIFSIGQADGAFGVGDIFSFRFADSPFVLRENLVIIGIDYGELALSKWDFAEGVTETQPPIDKYRQNQQAFEPVRDCKRYNNLDDTLLRGIELISELRELVN